MVYAHEVGALHPRIASYYSGVRMPTYKANDSNDLHLMELISPSHELHRKLMEGSRRPMTQQPTPTYLQSPTKSLDSTPRTKYKKTALKALQTFPLSSKLNVRLFGTDRARPRSANELPDETRPRQPRKAARKSSSLSLPEPVRHSKPLPMSAPLHQNTLDLEDIRFYKSELSTHRKSDTETSSGYSSQRGDPDQKASDLRMISQLWHQDCESSVAIQQQLGELLNAKYQEVFEDGRISTSTKCKNQDFKAEVAQILKNLERAGAPQMATLHLRYELAVASVDEVLGEGMGEEYMLMEGCFLQSSSRIRVRVRVSEQDADLLKEIAGRVEQDYENVQRIAGYMLGQLNATLIKP